MNSNICVPEFYHLWFPDYWECTYFNSFINHSEPCCVYFVHRVLDLSFNRLSKMENMGTLFNLQKLFLIHNKFTKIENIDHMVNLEMLELGSNRIRVTLLSTQYTLNLLKSTNKVEVESKKNSKCYVNEETDRTLSHSPLDMNITETCVIFGHWWFQSLAKKSI